MNIDHTLFLNIYKKTDIKYGKHYTSVKMFRVMSSNIFYLKMSINQITMANDYDHDKCNY